MYKDNTFLEIIPARGGSKRQPSKNPINLKITKHQLINLDL